MTEAGRFALLSRLRISPPVGALVHEALDRAIGAAEGRSPGTVSALDAGCGRVSALRAFRPRIGRLVGADLHRPSAPLPHLDELVIVDLCGAVDGFARESFDVVLSSFTLEHFADPPAALANFRGWLRPGGTLVATTVNRRHPFVAAYLGLPDGARRRLQPLVKATAGDAHPLVGACNDPDAVRAALADAGFTDIRLTTVGHLARAWGRHWPTFALGLLGDLLTTAMPSRRSTIVAVARVPAVGA
ncbi:MAG: methyltransferase domain-containing protein [Candidatus Limnocylindrales bacterium]|nr:methyltransferase domain-containing protein [Candidatus Limnocylindrales bacterium]